MFVIIREVYHKNTGYILVTDVLCHSDTKSFSYRYGFIELHYFDHLENTNRDMVYLPTKMIARIFLIRNDEYLKSLISGLRGYDEYECRFKILHK